MHRFKPRLASRIATLLLFVLSPLAWADTDNAATRWMEETLESVRVSNTGTASAGRVYAMSTVAMYDAVNGIDRASNVRPRRDHALVAPAGAPGNADRDVAAAAAAHAVLLGLFPAQSDRLNAAFDAELLLATTRSNRVRIQRGHDWGRLVGERAVALRSADGSQGSEIIAASTQAGQFHLNWNAQARNIQPFGVADISAFINPEGPPALGSREYAAALFRTFALGAPDGDPGNDALAAFWRYPANSVTETGGWFLAALAIVRQEGTTRSISDTTRLLALLGMAMADSAILSWNEKALHFTWRPTFGIRRADEDGNPLTDLFHDPLWVSRFGQIGTSPEWTSGQSTFAGAGAAAIGAFYCRDDIAFAFSTGNIPQTRSYGSLSETAAEMIQSRILQGIHLESTNRKSEFGGRAVATEIVRTRLQRLDGKPEIVKYCPQF